MCEQIMYTAKWNHTAPIAILLLESNTTLSLEITFLLDVVSLSELYSTQEHVQWFTRYIQFHSSNSSSPMLPWMTWHCDNALYTSKCLHMFLENTSLQVHNYSVTSSSNPFFGHSSWKYAWQCYSICIVYPGITNINCRAIWNLSLSLWVSE